MCAVSPRTRPGRRPRRRRLPRAGGPRGAEGAGKVVDPARPGSATARTPPGRAAPAVSGDAVPEWRLPACPRCDPRSRDVAPCSASNRQCAMEALPQQAHAGFAGSARCFDLILGLSQSRDGRYSRNNVDGSASIDRGSTKKITRGRLRRARGTSRRPTAGQPGRRRQPSPRHREGGGTRATRVARLPRDTHGRTPIPPVRVCNYGGDGGCPPRPHTKPPYTMGKEADGTGAPRRPARPRSPRSAGRPPTSSRPPDPPIAAGRPHRDGRPSTS